MEKDRSKLLAVLLVIITIIVVILSIIFKKENSENEEIKIVSDPSDFFTVNSCLYRMTTYIQKKDTKSLLQVLDEGYKKKNSINQSNIFSIFPEVNNESNFVSKKMYYSELNSDVTRYYVYGIIEENVIHDYTAVTKDSFKETYFIVNLDSNKKIFSIEPYNGEIFMDGGKDG